MSTPKHVYAGVSQGSVLVPMLFLIYVNDVANSMLTFCRFGDDNSYLAQGLESLESLS